MKKIMKMSGILFLALTLACTTAVTVDAGKTASAKAIKAKTLKMKKKKVTITAGQKLKLAVTVKPKKATIKWSSNKKKIATVSKKGEVSGKKPGTAKITAKSGKKKAVCTVNVKAAPAGIKSITVTNPKIVRVTLTKAASLNAADFVVKKKGNAKGAYNTTLKVANITKISSTIYELNLYTDPASGESSYIDDINYIAAGDYVQVTIKKLKGTQTGETVYYQSNYANNIYATGKVGEKFEHSYSFSQDAEGYISGIKVSGIPSGLTAKAYGNTVYVSGTPTVAKASVMTMTGKDELGKNLTQKVYFYIGSDAVMLSYTHTEGRTILTNDNSSEYFQIYTVGGSGNYTYSLNNNQNKFINIYEEDGEIYFRRYNEDSNGNRTYLNPGTYNVSYTVKDDKGHTNTGTLSVTAVKGVMVSGKVTAGDNTGIEDADVRAYFDDDKYVYYRNVFYADTYYAGATDEYSTAKKAAGDYNMIVYPSQVYDFRTSKNGLYVYADAKRIGTAATTINFQLPIYKVTISGIDDPTDIYWYDSISNNSYYGSTLYLKKGSYKLTSSNGYITYVANFTVNGNMTVTATKQSSVTVKGTLTLNTPAKLSLEEDNNVYYTFTPSASGYYTLSLNGLTDYAYAEVYESSDRWDAIASDSADSEYDYETDNYTYFLNMNMSLTAGKTYYLKIYSYATNNNATATITTNSEE